MKWTAKKIYVKHIVLPIGLASLGCGPVPSQVEAEPHHEPRRATVVIVDKSASIGCAKSPEVSVGMLERLADTHAKAGGSVSLMAFSKSVSAEATSTFRPPPLEPKWEKNSFRLRKQQQAFRQTVNTRDEENRTCLGRFITESRPILGGPADGKRTNLWGAVNRAIADLCTSAKASPAYARTIIVSSDMGDTDGEAVAVPAKCMPLKIVFVTPPPDRDCNTHVVLPGAQKSVPVNQAQPAIEKALTPTTVRFVNRFDDALEEMKQ